MAVYTVGSLFSGYGGLDLGVTGALGPGGDTLFVSDVEKGPCAILAHRFPDAPNVGDITRVDWRDVPRVDVLCGGSPCTDLSTAGARAGMTKDTRSGLWESMFRGVQELRPRLVVWENVLGATSARAFSLLEQRGDAWERRTVDLFSEHSDVYSETWPQSGMMRSGVSYRLPPLALPTSEPESSLLLTPTANLGSNGGSQPPEKRRAGGHGPTLADQIEHM